MMNEETDLCLCSSGIEYGQCCGRFHRAESVPATAEALMRSRFAAYVLHDADYLRQTWDSGKCRVTIDFSRETAIWQRLGADLKPPALERIVSRTVALADVIPACATLMNRTALGRVLVDCR